VIRSGAPKLGIMEAIRDRQGNEVWMQTDKVPVRDHGGKITGIIVMSQDITQRKRAEETLRESEERFSNAFEYAPIGVALVAPDGRWLKVNRALCELVGYSEAELLARTYEDITQPADFPACRENVQRLLAGEISTYQSEKHYVHKGGNLVTVSFNLSLVRDGQGRPLYLIAQIQDITERQRAASALLDSKRFLRSTLDALSAHIAILDERGTIIEVNAAWNRVDREDNFKRSQGRGENYLKVCDSAAGNFSKEAPLVADGIRAVMAGRRGEFHLEYPCHSPQEKRWFIVRVTRFGGDGPVRVVVAHENITERKQAEASLVDSQQRLALAKESAHIGIWDWNVVADKLEWDAQMYALYGIRRQDFNGAYEGWQKGLHAEDRARSAAAIRAALDGVKDFHIEFRVVWPTGEVRHIEAQAQVLRAGDGSPARMIGVNWDITERKKIETALKESERRYHSLFDTMLEGYAYCRLLYQDGQACDYIYLEVNRAFETQSGLKNVVGKKVSDIVPGMYEANPEQFEIYNRVALTGWPEQFESHAKLLDIWFSISVYSHEKEHFIVVFDNITERKRMEARFRRLVDSNVQGVMFWNKKGEITGANDAFLKLVHHTRADLEAGRINWIAMTPPEFVHLDQRALAEIAATGSSAPYEKEFVLPDGSRVPVLLGAAIFADSTEEGVCFMLDLSARKKLEVQLVQLQKLETVGKLAGGIAHEFNSILTAILGQSELLLADLPAGSTLAQSATEISKAANRAATLTRQLLAYGRKQFLQPEVLELNRVVAGMESVFNHLMGGDVTTQIVATPGRHTVKADAGQIEQVMMNIVINARDAMPNGGRLTLEIANVAFDAESVGRYPELKPGEYVRLAISDTGTGMSEAVKARAFEPFFTTKGVGQGTGLGLSTCYGIIKQSGGHISVYSELGRGTTFKIYLPRVAPPPAISVPRLDAPDLPRGTESILLVEDDPALREMAATLLRRLGYTVFAAGNGVEALSLKHERSTGHIDLLFTDVVMPHMSGKELADRVRALYPHTKILFTSAYTENAIVHQGVLNKGVALLQKPFTPSALAHKLRAVLDQPGPPAPADAQETFGFPNA
jgi:PAS domain S-box-containing protein